MKNQHVRHTLKIFTGNAHAALAKDALVSGAAVLVEKPITTTIAEWESLSSLAKTSHTLLVEDQNFRFNYPIQAITGLIDSGAWPDLAPAPINFSPLERTYQRKQGTS